MDRPFIVITTAAVEKLDDDELRALLGHEIGHGFDDQGSQYDEVGNLENWWTADDRAAFQERADKLIKQYDGYEPTELPGEHVNGALTVGENIGDLGGLTIALKAYQIALESTGATPPMLDGLTGLQRVFFGWAQLWRAITRDAEAVRRMLPRLASRDKEVIYNKYN